MPTNRCKIIARTRRLLRDEHGTDWTPGAISWIVPLLRLRVSFATREQARSAAISLARELGWTPTTEQAPSRRWWVIAHHYKA